MQASELLNQLHDIQLPDPIGWWPLAYTWWIMIFVLFSILMGVLWYYLDMKRRNAYRVNATRELNQIRHDQYSGDTVKIAQINRLLKQVALTAYGRKRTAILQSQNWTTFLHETCSYIKQPDNLKEIIEMGYEGPAAVSYKDTNQAVDQLHAYALKWVKGHHQ